MADKKPLRISDDINDLNPTEFGAADTIGIDNGGTSANTANDALNNLLPSQTGNSGKVLQTDGSDTSWEDASTPGAGIGGVRVSFWHDGSGKNQWLQRDNHHTKESGPDTDDKTQPWTFPFDGEITTITFMNERTDAETDIEIYKNGTLQDTIQVRQKKWQINTNVSAISFSAGDHIGIFLKEFAGPGDDPSQPLVDVFIAFTSNVSQELSGTGL